MIELAKALICFTLPAFAVGKLVGGETPVVGPRSRQGRCLAEEFRSALVIFVFLFVKPGKRFVEVGAIWIIFYPALKKIFAERKIFALRVKAQREYFALGKDFLERGIKNNPDRPRLHEALARLYKEKYQDHERASEFFAKAASLPGAPSYDRRFSAYELSHCEGREREAYERLRQLYDEGEKERLPTLITRLKFLENKLGIQQDQRIPGRAP